MRHAVTCFEHWYGDTANPGRGLTPSRAGDECAGGDGAMA